MTENNQSATAMDVNPTIAKSVFIQTDSGNGQQIAYMEIYLPKIPDRSVNSIRLESEKFMRTIMSVIADYMFCQEV